ncbi:MAG: XdhC family protein [Acidobacteria bacterium]|nr:XdhC family protein [Acidobacteriota bacterium]MBI3425719.1 XdhC family protein [Acidobacteriota bacterium]
MGLLTLNEVYNEVAKANATAKKLAVAAIVTTSGSTPQRTGAKLLVYEDGRMLGTVGGGCVEADVWAEAREALQENAARLCQFTLRDNPDVPPDEEGMVCGGDMEVFIEVWPQPFQPFLTAEQIAELLNEARQAGHSLALVSLLVQGATGARQTPHLVIDEQGKLLGGTLGDADLNELAARQAVALLADERAEIIVKQLEELPSLELDLNAIRQRNGEVRLLFELARPPLELLICGGGHVGQAIAKVGRLLDFNVTVIDDRAEFAARDKFPDPAVQLRAQDFVEALRSIHITPATHIVIVTRGHRHDEICLEEVIEKPARYIGMIGSRRRTTTIRERLKRAGVAPELLRCVHAPIGLDIGALTPEEIALAILAEIVLVRRGGSGRPKSYEGPMAHAR